MVAFQSLGELSSWMDTRPGVEIADPGVELLGYSASLSVDHLRKHPSVRKVTQWKARRLASIPVHLFRRADDTDRVRVTDHRIATAMAEPSRSPSISSYTFRTGIVMDLLLWDKACIVIDDDGVELTLTRIPASKFSIVGDFLQRPVKVRCWNGGRGPVEIPLERCLVVSGYSTSGVNGLSPLETLADELEESRESTAYRRQLWQRGARTGQAIERPKDAKWSTEARARFKRDLEAFAADGAKAGRPILLEDGMTIKNIDSISPKDAEVLEGRKLTDIQVASAYDVPPELVGAREGTYSNIEAFRQMVYGDVLGPDIFMLDQLFNHQLVERIAPGEGLYVESAVEAKMRGSFLDQAKYGQTVVGAPTMTRNEWRSRMNLPAVDGGDELITPLNVLVGGQASPTDSAPDPARLEEDAN